MYANVVSLHYKSAVDAEEGIKLMESAVIPQVRKLVGFKHFQLVRTSETTSIHVGVFDSAENAEKGRTTVYPFMRDLVSPHLAGAPKVEHGYVQITA